MSREAVVYRDVIGEGYKAPKPKAELGELRARPYGQVAQGRLEEHYGQRDGYFRWRLGSYAVSERVGRTKWVDRATVGYKKYEYIGGDSTPRLDVFLMGGGPLFSPVTLDLGLLGPEAIEHQFDDGGNLIVHRGGRNGQPTPTLLESADIVRLESVGTGHLRGPGKSQPLGKTPESYFWDMWRDAKANASVIKALHKQDIALAFTSMATLRAVATALRLVQDGIRVKALICINGQYDYADQDYRSDSPFPSMAIIPGLALANHFHDRPGTLDLRSAQQLHDDTEQWLLRRYLDGWNARASSLLRQRVAEELGARLLPRHLHKSELHKRVAMFCDEDLHVDPVRYTRTYSEDGRVMSILDPRYLGKPDDLDMYDAYKNNPDLHAVLKPDNTAVDGLFAYLLPIYKAIGNDYMHVPMDTPFRFHQLAYHGWGFPDIWAKRSMFEPFQELLRQLPDIRVVQVESLFDTINPPARGKRFRWQMRHLGMDVSEGGSIHAIPPAEQGNACLSWKQIHSMSCHNGHFPGATARVRRDVNAVLNGFLRNLAAGTLPPV